MDNLTKTQRETLTKLQTIEKVILVETFKVMKRKLTRSRVWSTPGFNGNTLNKLADLGAVNLQVTGNGQVGVRGNGLDKEAVFGRGEAQVSTFVYTASR